MNLKSIEEITAGATDDDGVIDLSVAIADAEAELDRVGANVSPHMAFTSFLEAQEKVNLYLGQLVLSIADEVNALPNGFESEYETLKAYLMWAQISSLYETIAAHLPTEVEGQEELPLDEDGPHLEVARG